MDGGKRSKRKIGAGLRKRFRDALTGAMGEDPTEHIRDSYQQKLDNEFSAELGAVPSEESRREDPIQIIRDGYKKRMGDGGPDYTSVGSLEEELRDEPIRKIKKGVASRTNYKDDVHHSIEDLEEAHDELQHIRDTYNRILDEKYKEPTAVSHPQQKEKQNSTGIDPSQRIREAYDRMFDDRENKYQVEQSHEKEQLPWWRKIF